MQTPDPLLRACRLNDVFAVVELLTVVDVNARMNIDGLTLLMYAAKCLSDKVIHVLLEAGADPTLTDTNGRTATDYAENQKPSFMNSSRMSFTFQNSLYIEVKELLEAAEAKYDPTKNLIYSIVKGNIKRVKNALENGADLFTQNRDGYTPLTLSACLKNIDLLKILLDHGAGINHQDGNGNTALISATDSDIDMQVWEFLLAEGADPELSNDEGNTPLLMAARHNHLEAFKLLQKAKANIQAINKAGDNALTIIADQSGGEPLACFLIAQGIDLGVVNQAGENALVMAAKNLHVQLVTHLLQAGIHPKPHSGVQALHGVIDTIYRGQEEKQLAIVKLLLEAGVKDDKALLLAVEEGAEARKKIVQQLLQAGANVNYQDEEGNTALHKAFGDNELIDVLLNAGANINISNWAGETPILAAIYSSQTSGIEKLMAAGAQINNESVYGTALIRAVETENMPQVLILLKSGANCDLTDLHGFTALMYAVKKTNHEFSEVLLKNGADPNILAHTGESALGFVRHNNTDMWALLKTHGAHGNPGHRENRALITAGSVHDTQMVQHLLEKGANPNIRNHYNTTALIVSAYYGALDVVKLLISAGADLNATSGQNISALQNALRQDHPQIVEILRQAGAKR